jgi:hypothetical protein
VGVVPYARRQELRAELRSHLEALVEGHQEMGSDHEVATLLALRQFGEPHHISRQWAREWRQGEQPGVAQPVWPAMRIALGCFGTASLLGHLLGGFLLVSWARNAAPPDAAGAIVLLLNLSLPVLAGTATGLLGRARQAMASFLAQAALFLPMVGISAFLLTQSGVEGIAAELCLSVCLQPLLWLPIGSGAAAVAGFLRGGRSPRPTRWVLR